MPLSEEEQRILRQIEQQLSRDHTFARDITPGRSNAGWRFAGWCLATVALFGLALVTMTIHPLLGFGCFVASVATALVAQTTAGSVRTELMSGLRAGMRDRSVGTRPPSDD